MGEFSHYGKEGEIRMVDVSDKADSKRRAVAGAFVKLRRETVEGIRERSTPKGDPLEIARIAGIVAGKKTSELIPLCHQITLSKLNVEAELTDEGVRLTAEAVTTAKTGVEMEALTAVSVAALTIYDMCKAVQRDIEIGEIRLLEKSGGKADYFFSGSEDSE
jgi:cyclic pyranopterin phosphate synthase